MSEYCKSGCELNACKLKELGRVVGIAASLASEVHLTDEQTEQIVDAHGLMIRICTEYAASEILASYNEDAE